MSEHLSSVPESDPSHEELDTDAILEALLDLHEQLREVYAEFDLAPGDVEDLLGADENDFLGNLATFACMYDVDPETLFTLVGISAEFKKPTTTVTMISFGKKVLQTVAKLRQAV